MKRLVLMRHAKSDWAAGQPDHDRPLNARGRRSAEALGDWLRATDTLPDAALCSTATRARETLAGLKLDVSVKFEKRLYHAGPGAMLRCLQKAQDDTVILIGHNPGIAGFAEELVSAPPRHPRFDDYPTGATLVATFDIGDWTALEPGTGRAAAFVIPRELLADTA
ncbi:SixA phosphatase family protein [Salipiger aestuarii]|uniref:Phosphohistidine phosphatase n=1 Tax=Salipiger aestuarii TaxID=568098 RepID=A0A327XUP7_9RHOB|nr:histidine phosphatase family protein [Salipiger aestuarii]KAA8609164.1 phosphoglycerate mutase [Salipiger aestuarii]KAB2540883.1 phosphoglycerate mutase [Salipiger aestuarii]RAK12410.1 phosphohistidine phosphatase [Salipiger aestuarii]